MDNFYAETWRDENGFTIDDINDFIDSIALNDIDEVREFLENGMDPNVVSYQGDKPLVVAAEDGLDEMVILSMFTYYWIISENKNKNFDILIEIQSKSVINRV